MGVVRLAVREERLKRVVGRQREASSVDEKLSGDVEEDEEEVESAETEDDVDLRDGRLLLEVGEGWVFGELPGKKVSGAP